MSITIALVSKVNDEQLRQLRQAAPDARFEACWANRDRLAELGSEAEIVYGNVRRHEVAALTGLRWVHATWSGVENLLSVGLDELVIVTNTRGQNAGPMAEHAVAGLCYLARDFPAWVAASRKRQWRTDDRPIRLAGSVALVLGTGAIARELIPLLNVLRLRVWGVNSDGRSVAGCERSFTMQSVRGRLGEVSFVICLLPDGPQTHKVIDHAFLGALQSGAGFVNLSRGGVVDQQALVELIDAGQLRGAVLDVTDPEPPPPDSSVLGHDRIMVTGHTSWKPSPNSGFGFELFVQNLRLYLAGKTEAMVNLVDKQRGY